ncbi:ABC transporter permease [Dyadobacter luticola]|uniref:FtsX-like permease family protein n=1 Tax=Dyadobacter luticola TaxID=1979387 RepID=A0A5R9KP27_9BACT|nr:FtsX-like permease family protein [Dyadobacter luticola]TLU98041.1 FtsX-like permease family protein [Dyadobacter luticola]
MNLLKISLANLKEKKLNSFLSALLLTLGIGMISLLLLLNKQLDEQFRKNIKGIDMVVGAKGSPLQLILSSIYQIDAPTGNVPLAEVNALRRNPFVKTVIPLSMGDNFQGFRIVGTTPKYIEHFGAKLAQGQVYNASLEVTIGNKVARMTNLKVGDQFSSAHGLDQAGEKHGEKKYKVTGIFSPNGSVVDQLILTRLSSVWDIHEHAEEHSKGSSEKSHEEHHKPLPGQAEPEPDEENKQVTSALVQFRNPMGLLTIPRQINDNTSMQAALPSIEISRLFSLLGVGIETLRALAMIIIGIAGVSVFVSLYNSLKERKYEMALMLSMGATRTRLFLMLLIEGLLLAVVGYFAGILLSRVGLSLFSSAAEQDFHYSLKGFGLLKEEVFLFFGALFIGAVAAALPSLGIYRLNISRTLAEE